jgi:hypothetical protein
MAIETLDLLPAGGGMIEGWRMETTCPACGGSAVYYLAYDATCCLHCNQWLALHCPDPGCDHCQCRPERPLAAQRRARRPRPGRSSVERAVGAGGSGGGAWRRRSR